MPRNFFFVAFLISSCLANSLGAAREEPLAAVKNQIRLVEGSYERVSGSLPDCQADLVDLKFYESNGNIILVLGERFTFTDLGAEHATDSTTDCSRTVENTVKAGQVRQTIKNICRDQSQSFQAIQVLSVKGRSLTYSYSSRAQDKSQRGDFTCVYKLSQNGGAGR